MTDFFFYLFRFLFGGAAYCTIELIYRGRTHYSMFFAGGIILAAFYCLERTQPDLRLALKCLMGAGIITGVELIFGLVFNCALGMGVWDYSRVPLNLWGQICQHLPCLHPLLPGQGCLLLRVVPAVKGVFLGNDPHTTPAHPRIN